MKSIRWACSTPARCGASSPVRARADAGNRTPRVKVLYLYCHPVPESFHGAIRGAALTGLAEAGHDVDLCDLYAENFDPVMRVDQRRRYHDLSMNQLSVESYVARLRAAEAIIVQFPVWCFGAPAMLKGFLDKVLLPGVSFDMSDVNHIKPLLANLKHVAGIATYGRGRWSAMAMGDAPRKLVTRYLPRCAVVTARAQFHALYGMNRADEARRRAFMAKTRNALARL
ncbi:MAG: NAD(P)H-dependent oxidoreductase [Hyphomicrobiales bacterium]|nr:NAD(P)H-dependent oxidoreductase [Hyphomicrobiales bacterium]